MKEENIHIDKKKQVQNSEVVNYIVFTLGKEEYAVPIEQVKEVTLTPTIYKMPKTPEFVEGVANIRGDVIAIVNLEERFGISKKAKFPDDSREEGYILVMEHDNYTIGFHVKEVPETLALPPSKISPTPDFFEYSQVDKEFIDGIGKIDSRLIILINMEKVLNYQQMENLSKTAQRITI